MAHALRYYKELTQPDGTIVRLEIHKKDSDLPALEIGKVVQALHLDIQGGADTIDSPIVKTSLTMTFVDAPGLEDGKKCGNWEEFYTPDSTMWKVVMKANGTTIWGGYVTPDSYCEDLRYRGPVTIIARDNIGHMQDFPFDMEGNAGGMVTLYELVNAAWAKIESPMALDWRHEEDDANYLLCDGVEAPYTYMNVSAFEDMNYYDAVEKALYAYGLVMRYTGRNRVTMMSLRDLPNQGKIAPVHIEPTFLAHAQRELAPAARRIEESVKYEISEALLPLVKPSDFRGDVVDDNVCPIANTSSGQGWSNPFPSSTLFFNPNGYEIEEYPYRPAFEMAKDQIYNSMFLLCDKEGLVEYSQTFAPGLITLALTFGGNIWLKDGKITNTVSSVISVRYAIKVTDGTDELYLTADGRWSDAYTELNAYRGDEEDLRIRNISHAIPLQAFANPVTLHFYIVYIDDLNATNRNIYVQLKSLRVIPNESDSLLETNNVNTVYDKDNNVIIKRDVELGPTYNLVFPAIIKNGIFIKSGNEYLPARKWAWSGGTGQQMAVYNHLQLLCYHGKPNNIISGDIADADFLNMAVIYDWGGAEHLLMSGSYNFLNGRIESAVLREFIRYDDMWSDVAGASLPETEQNNRTTAESGSGTSNAPTYTNQTTVNIGGDGDGDGGDGGSGGSITIDAYVSTTSTNAVQNQAITNYVNGQVANVSKVLDWFEFDRDAEMIKAKYGLYSVGAITAGGKADEDENPSTTPTGGVTSEELLETLADYATQQWVTENYAYSSTVTQLATNLEDMDASLKDMNTEISDIKDEIEDLKNNAGGTGGGTGTAEVTADTIKTALGYTPMEESKAAYHSTTITDENYRHIGYSANGPAIACGKEDHTALVEMMERDGNANIDIEVTQTIGNDIYTDRVVTEKSAENGDIIFDKLHIGDAILSWDSDAQMLKFNKGIYSIGAVTAGGSGTSYTYQFDDWSDWVWDVDEEGNRLDTPKNTKLLDYALSARLGVLLNERLTEVENNAPIGNLSLDINAIINNAGDGVSNSAMTSAGLTNKTIENLLDGRYNKVVGNGTHRGVWNYSAFESASSVCIFLRQGDGAIAGTDIYLSKNKNAGTWQITVTEI